MRSLIFILSLVEFSLVGIKARAAEPYPLDLAFSRRLPFTFYEKAEVSPTGRHVAYGVFTPGKGRDLLWTLPSGMPVAMLGARLWLADVGSGKAVALGAEGSMSFAPVWSPDGSKLAYYSDEGNALRAWVFDVTSGTARVAASARIKVHLYSTTVMPPSWSPDSRTLLVPALPAAEAHADPRPARGRATTGTGRPEPGTGILVLTSGTEPAPPAEGRVETFSRLDTLVDILAINLRDGSTRVLIPAHPTGRAGPAFARYSPSGRYLVYVSCLRPGPALDADDVLDLGLIKVGEGEPRFVETINRIYDGQETYTGDQLGRSGVILAWHPTEDRLLFLNDNRLRQVDCTGDAPPRASSPAPADWGRLNGHYLAFAQSGRSALVGILPTDATADSHKTAGLGLVPLAGDGPARRFALPGGMETGKLIRRDRVSLWEPVPDSVTLLTTGDEAGETLVRRLDLIGGTWTTVRTEPSAIEFQGMPPDGSFLVGTVESYTRPPDYYRLGTDFAPTVRLGTIEPRLNGRDLGLAETFRTVVPLHDGTTKGVRSAVLLPPGSKRGDRLPALVVVYGDADLSRQIRDFGGGDVGTIPATIFTSRGFAVLLVHAPMGPDGKPGQPIEELRDAVLPQVEHAADLGYIDIERVAVMGQSYGGYCTASLISASNRFRAAVAISGIYDLAGGYRLLHTGDDFGIWWTEKGQGRMGLPPWSDLRRYVDNSPYFRADRIKTPLLIVHGRDDVSCRVEEAEKLFGALKRLGRTAQLAVYDGQGHVISEWDPKLAVDVTERILSFLRRHLDQGRGQAVARCSVTARN